MNVSKERPSCANGQTLTSSAVETLLYDAERAEKGSMTHDLSACAKLRASLKGASTSGAVAGGKRALEEGQGEEGQGEEGQRPCSRRLGFDLEK
jgi:hypothetical protein